MVSVTCVIDEQRIGRRALPSCPPHSQVSNKRLSTGLFSFSRLGRLL